MSGRGHSLAITDGHELGNQQDVDEISQLRAQATCGALGPAAASSGSRPVSRRQSRRSIILWATRQSSQENSLKVCHQGMVELKQKSMTLSILIIPKDLGNKYNFK